MTNQITGNNCPAGNDHTPVAQFGKSSVFGIVYICGKCGSLFNLPTVSKEPK